jgi:hypothetical protein
MKVCSVKDGESNFLAMVRRRVSKLLWEAYKRRLAQYFRASSTSASVSRDACGAGVLYEVVAYLRLEFNRILEHFRSRTLALVEHITLNIINTSRCH